MVLLVWPLAAFGGSGFRAAAVFAAACVAAAVILRPRIAQGGWRQCDCALITLLTFILLQLLPLPTAVWRLLSPSAEQVAAAIALTPAATRLFEPISLDSRATLWAALVVTGSFATFVIARQLFSRGSVRTIVRAICSLGMAVSALAIAQAATAGRRIYWTFPTDHEGPLPFGPFINRNHFATWVIMAAPLCFGYLAARSDSHATGSSARSSRDGRIASAIDGRGVWLFACGTTMVAALLLTLSRSGIISLALAGSLTILVTRPRGDSARHWWFGAAAAGAFIASSLVIDMSAVTARLAAASTAIEGRTRIWAETLPVVRDFWLTGAGAGTYETAMLLYQQSDRLWYYNQAHNHYLQLAAEGGLLLGIPAAFALFAYSREALRRIARDRSGIFWILSGVLCGLGAAALQSVWETGLTMPANAALAAVLAAIGVHERSHEGRG